jgi:hypothetical protein
MEKEQDRDALQRTVGMSVTWLHWALGCTMCLAIVAVDDLAASFKLFLILASLLLFYLHFGACALHVIEKHYNPGFSYTEICMKFMRIDATSIENSLALQVIVGGVSLLMLKIAFLIVVQCLADRVEKRSSK